MNERHEKRDTEDRKGERERTLKKGKDKKRDKMKDQEKSKKKDREREKDLIIKRYKRETEKMSVHKQQKTCITD